MSGGREAFQRAMTVDRSNEPDIAINFHVASMLITAITEYERARFQIHIHFMPHVHKLDVDVYPFHQSFLHGTTVRRLFERSVYLNQPDTREKLREAHTSLRSFVRGGGQ